MEEDFTLLIKYLDGDLSAAETAVVQQRLENEADLQALLQEAQQLQRGVQSHARRADFAKMADWDATTSMEQPRRLTAVWKYVLPLAASVALLIGGWWWYQTAQPSAEMQLAMEYFEPFPPIGNPRSAADELAVLKGRAFTAYQQKEYGTAIPLLLQVTTEFNDSLSRFYLGVSYLGNQQPQRAVEELEVFSSYSSDYQGFEEQSWWYLGLAYIANNEVDKGKVALNKIEDSERFRANILEIFNILK